MQLLISDANILIDMEEGELITLFFNLPYEFCVPDVLYYEELEDQHSHLCELGLGLKELTSESLSQVAALKGRYAGPSTNDVFALLLAQQEGCPLLSGDRELRDAAQAEMIDVRGTLWLVEELVQHGLIDTNQALVAYDKMKASGRRLPWAEAKKRIRQIHTHELEIELLRQDIQDCRSLKTEKPSKLKEES